MHVINKNKKRSSNKIKRSKDNTNIVQNTKVKLSVTDLINQKLKTNQVDNLINLCLVELLEQLDSNQLDICIIYAEYSKAYQASEMLKNNQVPSEELCKSLVRVFNRLDKFKLKNRLSFSSYLNAIRILEDGSPNF